MFPKQSSKDYFFYRQKKLFEEITFLDQKDRHTGVDAFRRGEKDVLVATDVASKGLDFENIQHVINFDMPEDIENYGN